jgi:hypothetical protein
LTVETKQITVNSPSEVGQPYWSHSSNDDNYNRIGVASPDQPPIQARLVAGGVSVTYRAPAPPLITAADVPILHYDQEDESDELQGPESRTDQELADFLAKVKGVSPLLGRRSDTSSASLPVSPWQSSRDSLLIAVNSPAGGGGSGYNSCGDDLLQQSGRSSGSHNIEADYVIDGSGLRGPASLTSEDFEPQIMTEDCVMVMSSSRVHGQSSTESPTSSLSSTAGLLLYTSFIPDAEVTVIENEFTMMELSPKQHRDEGSTTIDSFESQEVMEYECNNNNNLEYGRAWRSTTSVAEIKAFWEARAGMPPLVKASSESNLFETGCQPPENGLREILKDTEFTSGEEEDEEEEVEGEEEKHFGEKSVEEKAYHVGKHVSGPHYRQQQQYEESGFYSYDYDNVIPEEPSDYEDSWNGDNSGGTHRHISLIAVAHNDADSNSGSSFSHNSQELLEDSTASDHVTVISVDHSPKTLRVTNRTDNTPTNTTNPHYAKQGTVHDVAGDEQPRAPFHCSVKDLRRLFERQAAADEAMSGGNRSSVPGGTVNLL